MKSRQFATILALTALSTANLMTPNKSHAQPPEQNRVPALQQQALNNLAGKLASRVSARRAASASFLASPDPRIQRILKAPGKRFVYVDERGHPEFHIDNNIDAARTISTDQVWVGAVHGFDLAEGPLIYLWESGGYPRFTHDELAGSIFLGDSPDEIVITDHATHVAGTLIAEGVVNPARGMVNTSIIAFDSENDSEEMALSAAVGATISNHSYGFCRGWDARCDINGDGVDDLAWYGDTGISLGEDYKFGFYTEEAREFDEIAHTAPKYMIVKSAGNAANTPGPAAGTVHFHYSNGSVVQSTDFHPINGPWDTLPQASVAKNIFTIGSIQDLPEGWSSPGSVIGAVSSSRGPTDDGRIKPDLVANGIQLISSVSRADDAYNSASGTSMASPNVSGSLSLLSKQYSDYWSKTPLSSTIKAIVVHTADEAGLDPGPDYQFGWGVMNTLKAAELIEADATDFEQHIIEETLMEGEEHTYTLLLRWWIRKLSRLRWFGRIHRERLRPLRWILQHECW